jgi:chromosome segregation ATPase
MSELRTNREWEHWPQDRRPEEGIRHKLRELFHPTAGDEEIERALAVQSHEIEVRGQELAETVADLERREERTHELRASVEQMLRRGSTELDERHAELSELAARLAVRESEIADAEDGLAERRRELGAVELRRAAVERREETLAEREEELARQEDEIREREAAVADLEEQSHALSARETDLARRADEVEALQARIAETLAIVEREQHALANREAALHEREQRAQELELRERELHASASELRTLEESLVSDRTEIQSQREELRQTVIAVSRGLGLATEQEAGTSPLYVALVPGDGRYRIVERDDGPPSVGGQVIVDEDAFQIVRLGSSPLPGDRRRCAYLEPGSTPDS